MTSGSCSAGSWIAVKLAVGRVHVRDVDEAGIGRALRQLADDPLDVRLVRPDVVENRLLLCGGSFASASRV